MLILKLVRISQKLKEFVTIDQNLLEICKILELFARSWSPNFPLQFSEIRSPAGLAMVLSRGHSFHFLVVTGCRSLLTAESSNDCKRRWADPMTRWSALGEGQRS